MGGTKMSQWQTWFHEKQVERTIKALKKNNFEALFVPDSKAAFEEVMKRIPDGTTVSVGGSITLGQVGLLDALEKRKINFIFPMKQGKTPEEVHALIQKTFLSDIYLSGTNAITEDGKLFNVDATGNRVGAMFIGPKKVIVVAGLNKIVPTWRQLKRGSGGGWVPRMQRGSTGRPRALKQACAPIVLLPKGSAIST